MAFNPEQIRKGVEKTPRKMIIYGPPKLGKSTLASAAPKALLCPTEDRVKHINCDKTPVAETYDQVLDVMEYLLTEKHSYKTFILDTIDWLEPMLHEYLCKKNSWRSITDDENKETNFFKGLKFHATGEWRKFLFNCDLLRDKKNMHVILVSHSAIQKIEPPDNSSYDRYSIKVDKYATAVLEEWADIISFYNREILVTKQDAGFNKKIGKAIPSGTDSRILNMSASTPAWIAGNSFQLPDMSVTLNNMADVMNYILEDKIVEPEQKESKNNKTGEQ